MADLLDIQAAQQIKIIGQDNTGTETNPTNASPLGDLFSVDILHQAGVQGQITVGTSAIEMKVGGSALANRKWAEINNRSNTSIYYGYTSGVTTTTGILLVKGSWRGFASDGANHKIFLIAGSAGNVVNVAEA